jgi:hypothetical protein
MLTLALVAALQTAPTQDILTIQHAPLAAMMRHPKDAGLARLLALAPAALERIAAEQGADVPPEMLRMGLELLLAGKVLTVGELSDPSAQVPVRASLRISAPDADTARAREEFVHGLIALAGMELGEPLASGLRPLNAPLPLLVALGTVGSDLTLALGTDTLTASAPIESGLPAGVAPWLQMTLDEEELSAFLGTVADMGGDTAEMQSMLDVMQMTSMQVALGADANRCWMAAREVGMAKELRASGALPDKGLTLDMLARIPADSTFASIGRMNMAGLWTMAQQQLAATLEAAGQPQSDLNSMVLEMTGIDLVADVLPHIGPTVGMYLSDTTGGGSFLSAAGFLEVRDRSAIDTVVQRVVDAIGEASGGEVQAELHTFTHGGVEFTSLVFPGLPVPVEPTWALDGGFLSFGLSPQAAIGAVEAARAGGGLPQNPRFRAAAEVLRLDGTELSLGFVDVPELLRDGYTWTSLGMGALSNLARSVEGAEDLGLLMPTYGSLARGAQAMLAVSRIDGDDTRSLTCMDPSWTVNATGLAGLLDRSGLLTVLPLALAAESSSELAESEFVWHEPLVEGGTLCPLYDETYSAIAAQLELHLDKKEGALTVYLTNADVTSFVRGAQETMLIAVTPEEGEPYTLTLVQVANEQTGETVGDSSTYRVQDKRLVGLEYLNGTVQSIAFLGGNWEEMMVWCAAPWQDDEGDEDGADDDGGERR